MKRCELARGQVVGRFSLIPALTVALSAVALSTLGCEPKEPPPDMTPVEAAPNPLPMFLRGTIRYEADLRGYLPVYVEGYGVVVGLDGTGSNDTPIPVRASIERQAARLMADPEIGSERPMTIQSVLADRNTAAVLVQAAIPPGAVKGTRFDLLVTAVNGSSTSSLEGGRLWTAELHPGLADREIGGTTPLALGRGDLFINPFRSTIAESGSGRWDLVETDPAQDVVDGSDPIDREFAPIEGLDDGRTARVLNGGIVAKDLPLRLVLRTPGFGRARAIIDAVNTRFPQEPGQDRATATPVSGRSSEEIAVTVPPSWTGQTETFAEILMHTQIAPGGMEARSVQLARWVTENPIDAPDITWCWVALGPLAVDGFAPLYEHVDALPRFAALHAGAFLGDPRVIPHLIAVAKDPDNAMRVRAINQLAQMPASPRINLAMRDLVNDEQLDVRVAAVDAMIRNRDSFVRRANVDVDPTFDIWSLPSDLPLVYVSLQGAPRIILFGEEEELPCPMFASTLGDRLLLNWAAEEEPLRVMYRRKGTLKAVTYEPPGDLPGFLTFLGAKPSQYASQPTLGLTYGEVLRILYEMQAQQSLGVLLKEEHNSLVASLIASSRQMQQEERPESATARSAWRTDDPTAEPTDETANPGDDSGVRFR